MTFLSLTRLPARRRSAGVGLVTAIFLLVVLAALGVAMVSIFNTQQQGAALDLQGARAYQAARAGVEWGLFQQMRKDRCAASTTFALPAGSTLSGFTVTVRCRASGAAPLVRHMIEAVACNEPGSGGECPNGATSHTDYVQRRMEVEL